MKSSVPDFPKDVSAAAADALELGVQQLVVFIRHSLGVGVIAMAAIAGGLRSGRAAAAEALMTAQAMTSDPMAKSMTASCLGRE
jgi:hypothetical protein